MKDVYEKIKSSLGLKNLKFTIILHEKTPSEFSKGVFKSNF